MRADSFAPKVAMKLCHERLSRLQELNRFEDTKIAISLHVTDLNIGDVVHPDEKNGSSTSVDREKKRN